MPGQSHPAVLPAAPPSSLPGLVGWGMHGGLARTPTELAGRASTWSDCSGRTPATRSWSVFPGSRRRGEADWRSVFDDPHRGSSSSPSPSPSPATATQPPPETGRRPKPRSTRPTTHRESASGRSRSEIQRHGLSAALPSPHDLRGPVLCRPSPAASATFGDEILQRWRGCRGTVRGRSTGRNPVHCVRSGQIPERLVQAERAVRPSSPLLIRGFGVRVPGGAPETGAPVLSCGNSLLRPTIMAWRGANCIRRFDAQDDHSAQPLLTHSDRTTSRPAR
jgi:hypothetical protein